MIWPSRANKKPPADFVSDVIWFLHQSHGVEPTQRLVDELYPEWVRQWRHGATAREVGRATCMCQKGVLVKSPGVDVEMKRGEMKPPAGAERGDTFGYEALRPRGQRVQRKKKTAEKTAAPPTPSAAPAGEGSKTPQAAAGKPAQAPKSAKAAKPSDKETEAALMASVASLGDED